MCLKAWKQSPWSAHGEEALGYGRADKQVHRRWSDTKIHVSIKFYTHFPCQLVTMNYKGWFDYPAKGDHPRPVIWTPSYGQRLLVEACGRTTVQKWIHRNIWGGRPPSLDDDHLRTFQLILETWKNCIQSNLYSLSFLFMGFAHFPSPFIHLISTFIKPVHLDNSPVLSFNLSLEFFFATFSN